MHVAQALIVFVVASLALAGTTHTSLALARIDTPHEGTPHTGLEDGAKQPLLAICDSTPPVSSAEFNPHTAVATKRPLPGPNRVDAFVLHAYHTASLPAATRRAHGARAPPAAND